METSTSLHRPLQSPQKDQPSGLPTSSTQVHAHSSHLSHLPFETRCLFSFVPSQKTPSSSSHHWWSASLHHAPTAGLSPGPWENPVSCGLGGVWPRGAVLGTSSRYSRPRSHQGVPPPRTTTQLGERQEPFLEEGLL